MPPFSFFSCFVYCDIQSIELLAFREKNIVLVVINDL